MGSGAFHDLEGVQIGDERVGYDNPRIFSYSELYIGSKGFSDKEVLGSGGFGRVYRAVLPSDGTLVAVKCLAERGEQFEKTFAAELVAVAHLRHRNLVRLRGWCVHEDQLFLVYDYMPNRSLDRVLFRKSENLAAAILDWEQRKRIVGGLAAALHYLHDQLETQIIHRDVKTSNVMLDSNYNARLGDFGLARWLEHESASATKSVRGIFGYMSPEYMESGEATTMADVYSFGVVVLEVVSGQMAVDFRRPEVLLVNRVNEFEAQDRALEELVDVRLDKEYDRKELMRLVKLGKACTRSDPHLRPSMRQIVSILDGNDQWLRLVEGGQQKNESRKEWRKKNASSLSLVKRVQALGIQ
ncbi:unnamed protein product [Linum tenue]|uniref:Protein kinase domain-containing protein n=1 Tax=Linum tenue TaxID=586396 RepID=A0AAV0H4T4_9ROSI|nr:unnamed protein product [Linum tenue]